MEASNSTKTPPFENALYSLVKFPISVSIGAVSGGATKTVFFPFEKVKLMMKLTPAEKAQLRASNKKPPSLLATLTYIKSQGMSYLWRGNLRNMPESALRNGLSFGFRDLFRACSGYNNDISYNLWVAINFASGAFAGASTTFLFHPASRITALLVQDQARMQKGEKVQFKDHNLVSAFKNVIQKEGFLSLYKGLANVTLNNTVHRALYFGLYDTFKPEILPYNLNGFLPCFLFAWATTIATHCLAYPLEAIKTRHVQIIYSKQIVPKTVSVIYHMIKLEGGKAFVKGMTRGIFFRTAAPGFMLALYDRLSASLKAYV